MTLHQKLLTCFVFLNLVATAAAANTGQVKFVNHSPETFSIKDPDIQKAAASMGLPIVIQSESDQNYRISLSDENVGQLFEYSNANGKLHFSIDVNTTTSFIDHHTTKQDVHFLAINWGNLLQHSDIHYVLPLFWKENNGMDEQQVRVDADNDAVIGIFSHKPKNVLTVMSYNTDKDGTGTDHNPKYNSIKDILSLFQNGRLPVPDVLMIQEGLGAQDLDIYKQALSQLVPGKWYGYYATEGARADSNIILVSPKYSSKNFQAGTLVFQNQCGWGLVGKRNAVYVDIPFSDILQTTASGNLRIFNTHLESGSGSDIFFHAAQVRFQQFNEILNYPQMNVDELIIGGDFNTMPIVDDATGLTHYQFGSLLSVFDNYLGDPNVNWGQPITCTLSTCAKYSLNMGMWLDRLFAGALTLPDYKTYTLYPFVAHNVNDGHSDHLPVWFTVYYSNSR